MKKQIMLLIVLVAFILTITGASSAVTHVDVNSPQYKVGKNVTQQALADKDLKISSSKKNLLITTASTAKLNGKSTEDSVQAVVDSTKNLDKKQQITYGSGNLLTINDPNGPLWYAFVSDTANGLMVKKFTISSTGKIIASKTVDISSSHSSAYFKKVIADLGSNGFAIANMANLWKARAPADLMAMTFTNRNINQGTISNYAATKTFALKYTKADGSNIGSNYVITTAGGLDDDAAIYGAFQFNDIVYSIHGTPGLTMFINYNGNPRSGTLLLVKNDLKVQYPNGPVVAGTVSEVKYNLWLLGKLLNNEQDDLFSVLAFKNVNENNIQYLWYDSTKGYGAGIDQTYINGLADVTGGWSGVTTVNPITDYDGMVVLGQQAFNYAFNTQHLFTVDDLRNGNVALTIAPYYVNYLGTRSLVGFIDGVVRAANSQLVLAGYPNAQGFTIDNILTIRNSWLWGSNIQTFFMNVDQASSQAYANHPGENLAMNYLTINSLRQTYNYNAGSYQVTRTTKDMSPREIAGGQVLGSFIIPAPSGMVYAWSAGASYNYLRTISRVGCICSTREYDLSMILQGQFPLGLNEYYILTVLTGQGETNRQISGRTTAWGVSPSQGTYYSVGQSSNSAYQLIVTIWNDVTQTGRSMLIAYNGEPIATAMANGGYTNNIYKQEADMFWHLDRGWINQQDVIASTINTAVTFTNMNRDFIFSLNSAGKDPISYMQNFIPPTVSIDTDSGTYNKDLIITLNAEPGAIIYYTIDGTTPTTQSPVYTGPISITQTSTLQYLVVQGLYYSPVYKEAYTINKPTPTPNPTPNPGTSVITDVMTGITGTLISIINTATGTSNTNTATNEIAPGLPLEQNSTNQSIPGIALGVIFLVIGGLLIYMGRGVIYAVIAREGSTK